MSDIQDRQRDAFACDMCNLRHKNDGLRRDRHEQNVSLGSVLVSEEPDRTVARIYKPLSDQHRKQLLALLSEIDRTTI